MMNPAPESGSFFDFGSLLSRVTPDNGPGNNPCENLPGTCQYLNVNNSQDLEYLTERLTNIVSYMESESRFLEGLMPENTFRGCLDQQGQEDFFTEMDAKEKFLEAIEKRKENINKQVSNVNPLDSCTSLDKRHLNQKYEMLENLRILTIESTPMLKEWLEFKENFDPTNGPPLKERWLTRMSNISEGKLTYLKSNIDWLRGSFLQNPNCNQRIRNQSNSRRGLGRCTSINGERDRQELLTILGEYPTLTELGYSVEPLSNGGFCEKAEEESSSHISMSGLPVTEDSAAFRMLTNGLNSESKNQIQNILQRCQGLRQRPPYRNEPITGCASFRFKPPNIESGHFYGNGLRESEAEMECIMSNISDFAGAESLMSIKSNLTDMDLFSMKSHGRDLTQEQIDRVLNNETLPDSYKERFREFNVDLFNLASREPHGSISNYLDDLKTISAFEARPALDDFITNNTNTQNYERNFVSVMHEGEKVHIHKRKFSPPPGIERKGHILYVPGATETTAKYLVEIKNLLEQGYEVTSMDLPGMGLSSRLTDDPLKMHAPDSSVMVRAVLEVAKTMNGSGPMGVFSHSTGSNIVTRAINQVTTHYSNNKLSSPDPTWLANRNLPVYMNSPFVRIKEDISTALLGTNGSFGAENYIKEPPNPNEASFGFEASTTYDPFFASIASRTTSPRTTPSGISSAASINNMPTKGWVKSMTSGMGPKVLRRFKRNRPNVRVNVSTGQFITHGDGLRRNDGVVDVGIFGTGSRLCRGGSCNRHLCRHEPQFDTSLVCGMPTTCRESFRNDVQSFFQSEIEAEESYPEIFDLQIPLSSTTYLK